MSHIRMFLCSCLACILLGVVTAAPAQNTLTLNVTQARTTISKVLFGGLLENWGRDIYTGLYVGRNSSIPNTLGMRNDIIEGFKECGLGILEYPGGCYADNSHWYDDTGAYNNRRGGVEIDSVGFTGFGLGTDEYMELCRLINSEPYICCNTTTGTPAEMAAWLRYINANTKHPGWYVKYWHMGNEPWGCGGGLNVSQYADVYMQYVNAVPTIAGKPLIRMSGNDYGFNGRGQNWIDTMMVHGAGKMEGINAHYYAVVDWGVKGSSFNYTNFQYFQVMQKVYEVPDIVRQSDSAMNKYDPNRNVGLMFNEWGTWYDQISSQGFTFCQSTVRDAIAAAIHLNTFANNCERVQMACVAQPVNVIMALFLTNLKDQRQMVKTPTFYVYKLFKPHQKAMKIPLTLQSANFIKDTLGSHFQYPILTASASVDSTKSVYITISNSHLTDAQPLTITLNSDSTYAQVTGQVITAPIITALNDFGKGEQVYIKQFAASNYTLAGKTITVTVPSKSVVALRLTPRSASTGAAPRAPVQEALAALRVKPSGEGIIVVNYASSGKTPVVLLLCGIDGRVVARTVAASGGCTWNLRGIGNGVYFVRVAAGGKTQTRQIVVAR